MAAVGRGFPGITPEIFSKILTSYLQNHNFLSIDASELPEDTAKYLQYFKLAYQKYDLSELKTLCFELGYQPDYFRQGTRSELLTSLISRLKEDKKLHLLEKKLGLLNREAARPPKDQEVYAGDPVQPAYHREKNAQPSRIPVQNIRETFARLGITPELYIETRSLPEIMHTAAAANYLSYRDFRFIADELQLTVAHLKLAAHLFLKSVGFQDKAAAYTELVDGNAREYLRDTILQKISEKSIRIAHVDKFLRALIQSVQLLKNIKDGANNPDPEASTALTRCEYCGTDFVLPKFDAVIQYPQTCSCCAAAGSLTEITVTNSKFVSGIRPDDPEIQRIPNFPTISDEFIFQWREVLSRFSMIEINLWFDRVFLKHQDSLAEPHRKRVKSPSKTILAGESKSDKILYALQYCQRSGVSPKIISESLFPSSGNYLKSELLLGDDVLTCYCADCHDVWLQPTQNIPLSQLSNSELYSPQGFQLPQIKCGNCRSENVHQSADFSTTLLDDLKDIENNSVNLLSYLSSHFTPEEFHNLIAYLQGSASFIEDLAGNNIADKMRELITHSQRRNQIGKLLSHIFSFRFEHSRGGMAIAVQCSHCNTVVSTSLNHDGMVMLAHCPTCAQVDAWTTYKPSKNVPLPDKIETMYHAFVENHLATSSSSSTPIPMTLHISLLPKGM